MTRCEVKPDPDCPCCSGTGKRPALVIHPEDHTSHVEYIPCFCVEWPGTPMHQVGLALAALVLVLLAIAVLV